MKRFHIIGLFILLVFAGWAIADSITLNSSESLQVPTSSRIGDWYIDYISASNQALVVKYYWEDANGQPITLNNNRKAWQTWRCRNIPVAGTNAECTAVDDPYLCCTGAGTGTCDDMQSTCFTDVFGFRIRAQDVGTSIGAGLRTLIWNRMKNDILTGGNDGSFD